ncbi:MAG TPA: molybdopterin-guanine dinucleotide biosynthesis protein B [Bacilli bacterium]
MTVMQIIGYANSGKTTLLCRLIERLVSAGCHVGTVKHDAHCREFDVPGKDSWRHRKSGAKKTAFVSAAGTAYFEEGEAALAEIINRMQDVDIVLVEGFKAAPYRKIAVLRNPGDERILHAADNVVAAAVWANNGQWDGLGVDTMFDIDAIEEMADYIAQTALRREAP